MRPNRKRKNTSRKSPEYPAIRRGLTGARPVIEDKGGLRLRVRSNSTIAEQQLGAVMERDYYSAYSQVSVEN